MDTQTSLNEGKTAPNIGNGKDHIYKIVSGAGKHSKGRTKGILKKRVNEYLKEREFDHVFLEIDGVHLIRLQKE
jgi:hypothetical protein